MAHDGVTDIDAEINNAYLRATQYQHSRVSTLNASKVRSINTTTGSAVVPAGDGEAKEEVALGDDSGGRKTNTVIEVSNLD